MPRKKVIKGGLVSTEIAESMSSALSDLPPGYFSYFVETPQQLKKLNDERHFFKCVAALMDADFRGIPDPDYSLMDKDRRRDIEACKWRFVSFFRMIRSNWSVVRKALLTMEIRYLPPVESMDSQFRQMPIEMIAPEDLAKKQPVDVAIEMMRLCTISKIHQAFLRENEWMKITPRHINRSIEAVRKSRKDVATKTVINNAGEEAAFFFENTPWLDLERGCYEAVAASNPKGERKADFNSYTSALREQEAIVKKRFRNEKDDHPLTEIWKMGRSSPYIHSQNGGGKKTIDE